ncbi:hypothetical protein QVD99_002637 [Batrachochytrium dendrobatidis]|nr:hypothetical protein QVD99_002637 [Batrachochytrium dendrobatidis]
MHTRPSDSNHDVNAHTAAMFTPFVAVHAGAGCHSLARTPEYANLLAKITTSTIQLLNSASFVSADEAVVYAIRQLESSSLTNAGIPGSNLTCIGTVECDAAIMTDSVDPFHSTPICSFGSVGGVPMTQEMESRSQVIASPIQAAQCISKDDMAGHHPRTGKVPPIMICGASVHDYALKHPSSTIDCISLSDARMMVTDQQLKLYSHHQHIVDSKMLMDTVGAVIMDSKGNISAGVSSGGISLKWPGRVGEAAIYGAGVWAQRTSATLSSDLGIGISVSGCGEQIIKTQLASRLADALIDRADSQDTSECIRAFIDQNVVESRRLNPRNALPAPVGCIALIVEPIQNKQCGDEGSTSNEPQSTMICSNQSSQRLLCEIWWAHTTQTMCFAYMSGNSTKPAFHMSNRADSKTNIVVGGAMVK